MEITPQTFIDMENNISENRLLVRKMIAAKSFGIIPRTKFSISHELLGGVLARTDPGVFCRGKRSRSHSNSECSGEKPL